MNFFPTLISRIFDPIIVLSVMAVIIAVNDTLPPEALLRFFAVFLIGMILPPVLFLTWAIRTKRVSNWDISNRRERVRAFTVFIMFLFIDLILMYVFGNSELMKLFLIFCFWFIGFFIITLRWKISGHVSVLTLASLFFIQWLGWGWWPIFFFVPAVAWARVAGGKHTVAEVIAGAFYSWVFVSLIGLTKLV